MTGKMKILYNRLEKVFPKLPQGVLTHPEHSELIFALESVYYNAKGIEEKALSLAVEWPDLEAELDSLADSAGEISVKVLAKIDPYVKGP